MVDAQEKPKNKHAVALGSLGGKVKSKDKARISRLNGALGGRPDDIQALIEILGDYLHIVGGHDENRKQRFANAQRILRKLMRLAPSGQAVDTK